MKKTIASRLANHEYLAYSKVARDDGPEFAAHKVDFDELTRRNKAYCQFERMAMA